MKNYKFVVGLLFSSALVQGTHAASATAQRPVLASAAGASVVFQDARAFPLPSTVANPVAVMRTDGRDELTINHLLSYVNLPNAFHYLDGNGGRAEVLRVQSTLAQPGAAVKDVTEPASEVLLLAGLSALAIAIRRQSPS